MKTNILCLVFLLFSLQLFSQTAIEPAVGSGSNDNPYQINSLGNLYWIAESSARWGYHYKQTSDIDASLTSGWFDGEGWLPIGIFLNDLDPDNVFFTGSYDGQGFVIEGLSLNRPEMSSAGLFGAISGAQISNLGLVDTNITGGSNLAALSGYVEKGSTIENCFVTGNIIGLALEGAVGSLAGLIISSLISNSSNHAELYGYQSVGGLAGYAINSLFSSSSNSGNIKSDISSWGIGGIVGDEFFSSINDCYSTGDISGINGIGGLSGMRFNSSINNSWSSGVIRGLTGTGGLTGIDVSSTIQNSYSKATIDGYYYAGGLAGFLTSQPPQVTDQYHGISFPKRFIESFSEYPINNDQPYAIEKSYSIGEVYGYFYTGGLVGFFTDQASVKNSYSTSPVNGVNRSGGLLGYISESAVINSYSIGAVSGEEEVGGLAGLEFESTFTMSYWNYETSGQVSSAGGEGRSTQDMTYPYSGNTYQTWDFYNVWSSDQNHSFNHGYPYLKDLELSSDQIYVPEYNSSFLYNYPNPFNPSTDIFFSVVEPGLVRVNVYNIKGQLKAELYHGFKDTGEYRIKWDGKNRRNGDSLPSGVYFCHLKTGDNNIVRKMLLLR